MNHFVSWCRARLYKWPVFPLLAWCFNWLIFELLSAFLSFAVAATFSSIVGILAAGLGETSARRLALAAGFPLSCAIVYSVSIPLWLWPVSLLVGLLLYPIRFWRDAPWFPTPSTALEKLSQLSCIPDRARVLDAGCGLGDGLIALRKAYPRAQYFGVEASLILVVFAKLRCRWARIRHGDMWCESWQEFSLVYLFQRPEVMSRAVDKASIELKPGALLISLEFEATQLEADAAIGRGTNNPVWIYRQPFKYADKPASTPGKECTLAGGRSMAIRHG